MVHGPDRLSRNIESVAPGRVHSDPRGVHRRLCALPERARKAILVPPGVAAAAHGATIPVLYACAFALGAFETLYAGATFAAVPALVDTDDLATANGRLGATQSAGAF